MSLHLVAGPGRAIRRLDPPTLKSCKMSRANEELQFYGPVPSAVSRWLLLMFWPLAFLVACLSWWLT